MKARNWWLAGGVAAVVLAAGGWVAVRTGAQGRRADLASGYVAQVVCACRYLGHRDLRSCATDLEPGMEIVRLADDPAARRITAWVPLLVRRSATYAPGYGCTLDQ